RKLTCSGRIWLIWGGRLQILREFPLFPRKTPLSAGSWDLPREFTGFSEVDARFPENLPTSRAIRRLARRSAFFSCKSSSCPPIRLLPLGSGFFARKTTASAARRSLLLQFSASGCKPVDPPAERKSERRYASSLRKNPSRLSRRAGAGDSTSSST